MLLLALALWVATPTQASLPEEPAREPPAADPRASQLIRSEDRAIVRGCAASMRARGIARISSDEEAAKLGFARWSDYMISATAANPGSTSDELIVTKRLDFNVSESIPAAQATELREDTRTCLRGVEAFWRRYGISLRITDRWRSLQRIPKDSNLIQIHESVNRSDAFNFFHGRKAKGYLPREHDFPSESGYCLMVLHETGHHFGLPDEYREEGVSRTFYATEKNPTSVMDNPGGGTERTELLPRHLKTILSPACPELFGTPARPVRFSISSPVALPTMTDYAYVRASGGRLDSFDLESQPSRQPYCEMTIALGEEGDSISQFSVNLIQRPLLYWEKEPAVSDIVPLLTSTATRRSGGESRVGRFPRLDTFRCQGTGRNLDAMRSILGNNGIQLR